jgi:hypothetical protein
VSGNLEGILIRFVVNTGVGKSVIERGFFDTYLRGKIQLEPYEGQLLPLMDNR